MLNGLEPDQDRQNVGPDLGQKCLQRLSADDKVAAIKERVNVFSASLLFQTKLKDEVSYSCDCLLFVNVYSCNYVLFVL